MKVLQLIKKIRERYFMSPECCARKHGVKIGKGCFISTRNFPSEGYLVEIGDYVRIATKTSFFTHGGIWSIRKIYNDPNLDHFGKIKVGNYSYIGENCMIMPGVTIGERCIVGGGSVVTKSIPDGCMVAGNPAKFIGYTEDFYHRLKKEGFDTQSGRLSPEEKQKKLLTLPETSFEVKKPIRIPETKQ